jgi:nicotinamidase-related amidase
MQRDFLEPGGFGEMLGNDVSKLARAIEPCKKVLTAARSAGMLVIHTREGKAVKEFKEMDSDWLFEVPPNTRKGIAFSSKNGRAVSF